MSEGTSVVFHACLIICSTVIVGCAIDAINGHIVLPTETAHRKHKNNNQLIEDFHDIELSYLTKLYK